MKNTNRLLTAVAAASAAALLLAGCAAGEGSNVKQPAAEPTAEQAVTFSGDTLNIDFATYNPLSLIIKDQGWLEDAFGSDVTVNWVQSAGSSKANEALRAGAIDIGSTAGSAALLAKANGSPIQAVDVYSQPDWAAIVVPAGSTITKVADLKGKSVAALKGTDPYFFLLQSLQKAGLSLSDVTVQNLAHADGKVALEAGAVDAWSGLDPLLSTSVAVAGSKIIYDNPAFNSYGFLNATDAFIADHSDILQVVVNAYEKAREFAIANPEETATILAGVAGIDVAIATTQLSERTNFDIDPAPGAAQLKVLKIIGPIFVESGDVPSQALVDDALDTLFQPKFAKAADPDSIG